MKAKLARALEPHAPPGADLHQELRWFGWGALAAIVFSLQFLQYYSANRGALYLGGGLEKLLSPRGIMPDFIELLGGSLAGFPALALATVAPAAYHYAGHHQGSKSVYLMRRLPSPWERHRRCLTLPVLGAAVSLLAGLLLLLLYFWVYMAFTPENCLAPGQWQKLWSVILGVSK